MSVEKMASFFDARINGYDDHMRQHNDDFEMFYQTIAGCVPADSKEILVLGCGTGADLQAVTKRFTKANFTCVDLSDEMLQTTQKRFSFLGQRLTLVKGSYFDVDYPNKYDAIVAVMTMHHWTFEEKLQLYTKIIKDLNPQGVYIEGDYYATLEDEKRHLDRYITLKETLSTSEYYHIDIPMNRVTQQKLYTSSGFKQVDIVYVRDANEIHCCTL